MRLDVILRIATKIFLPFIFMFAIYVQLHGDFGPGGGFQAGVILAAGIILYTITFGERKAKEYFPEKLFEIMIPIGVLIFILTGMYSLIHGYNFLDYDAISHHGTHGQHLGVLVIEMGVLITVSGSMVTIFYNFINRD